VRLLLFNEGNLGAHIMGQGQLDAALRSGLLDQSEIEGRFAGLSPMGRVANALAHRAVRPLSRRDLDLRITRWHLVQSWRAQKQVRLELRSRPADAMLVHTQSVALTMRRLMRSLPVFLSVDTTIRDWSTMPAWRRETRGAAAAIAASSALERRAMQSAALVLAWTDWARRSILREAPSANVLEHHPGIDVNRYAPAQLRERPRPRALFVGGRFAQKGGEDLLAAVGGEMGREVDLDIVTPSAVSERPGVTVHRLEAADPRLLDLYQQADVFVLPTYGDAAPWAVLEAMSCGTPVVSTPVGGIPSMLEDGRAGVLVPYGDVRAIGEALRGLLADPDRRARLGAKARERCVRHYDSRTQFTRLAEYFRRAVEQGGAVKPS
jgi:glycosyltransferase involved in cell wall biosynthesis